MGIFLSPLMRRMFGTKSLSFAACKTIEYAGDSDNIKVFSHLLGMPIFVRVDSREVKTEI